MALGLEPVFAWRERTQKIAGDVVHVVDDAYAYEVSLILHAGTYRVRQFDGR